MSRTISTLSLTLVATALTTLVAACGAEAGQPEPITQSDKVAEKAQQYAGDPWERRFLKLYFSDRAMSDVWQRHPELIGR